MTGATRRVFLGALAGSPLALGAGARRAAPVRVAVVGLRSRGLDLVRSFAKDEGSRVVAVCDVDDAMIGPAVSAAEKAGAASAPKTTKDFRRLLEDKEIDVLAVATPDHWHALMTIMACESGKDVYVEKPASHNLIEGHAMVDAARKHDRVVQVGTQRRSSPGVSAAVEFVRSGALGKVAFVRCWIMQKRESIGKMGPSAVPAGVDYEMWQGPAPDRPFVANRFHYGWHWFWNWGTGELGNNGIHGVDVARWGLGVEAPLAVVSAGGKYVFDDDQEVPDTQTVSWEFPGATITWEHRTWDPHPIDGASFGIAFHGEKGVAIVEDQGWRVEGGPTGGGKSVDGTPHHVANFLECVRTRSRPNADIEVGHLSTRLCHLGNVAHRVGRRLAFDAATETFTNDPEANALLGREYGPRFQLNRRG